MTLSALVDQMGGELIGRDVEFSRLSTDTRKISTGDAFLALVGEHYDGNEFIEQAKQRGASAAVVSRQLDSELSMLQVPDTKYALGQIARINRNRSQAKVIALTGSQGKTTVKEMLGTILGSLEDTLITQANLNNTIGVPLTLLQLNENHRFAVIEMGADKKGEIAFSTRIALPDIALITNANLAHLEGFGSLAGIVSAKGEITEGLNQHGVLVLNADDAHVDDWIKLAHGRRVVLFSYDNQGSEADFYAADVRINDRAQVGFNLITPLGSCDIEMKLLGRHTVLNAVAAAATAIEAGAELTEVRTALAAIQPIAGRLCPLQGVNQSWLIDDTYNASPDSFRAAIDVLMSFPGKKILIAGDMGELGSESAESHIAVGAYAKSAGVDHLWAVGELSKLTVKAFGDAGIHCKEKSDLVKLCRDIANSKVVFLVKGSRAAHMDWVVNEIRLDEDN